jgi:Mg-chelatase subunit ChlD
VEVADLIDYHHHSLPPPKAGETVALDVRCATASVAAGGATWLQIGISTARSHDVSERPPLALALAVDCSGSMADAGKMETVHAGLRRMVERLRPEDRLAIVAWSDEARLVLPLASVGDGVAARRAIEELAPSGSTNLEAGLACAFASLRDDDAHRAGAARRVILLTDGIANRGVTDPEEILRRARRAGECGIDLATVGVGADLNHDLLQRLARGGRGLYHFVSDRRDLAKVFVDDLQSLLLPVARRVRLDVVLPRGLRVDRVYGHDFEPTRAGFAVRLDDLNAGTTRVVLARLDAGSTPGPRVRIDATLAFDAVGGAVNAVRCESTTLRLDRCGDSDRDGPETDSIDPEVTKNVTIALLADALHEAARAAAEGSPHRARRILDRALAVAPDRRRNGDPYRDDADVRRILGLVRSARTIVADRSDDRGRRGSGDPGGE